MTQAEIAHSLEQMTAMLANDGYLLDVDVADDDRVALKVSAGPDACEDCLVPKDLFIYMANDMLQQNAITASAIDVTYPAEH